MKVLLENYFPPLVDLLGSYQDPLYLDIAPILSLLSFDWLLSRELASSCLGDNFPRHTFFMPPRQ